jgi:hypothetical protein
MMVESVIAAAATRHFIMPKKTNGLVYHLASMASASIVEFAPLYTIKAKRIIDNRLKKHVLCLLVFFDVY